MTVACSGGNCFARALRACAVALAATALVACHGRNIPPPGTVVLTLGDTSGDFPSYQVTLDSIVLTQADGTQAAVWLTPELVDLAKLTDFSELVGAPAVTSGTYTSATLTVDYTAAAIYFNKAGHAQLCNAVGPTGAALLVQTLTINFDPANPLVITAGKSTRAALDFDLAASNSVNTAVTPCVATVHPFATMRPAPVDGTVLRSRGLLVLTQPSSNDFIMNTRPLFDLVSIGFGALTVNITPQTYFNVNGVTYTGVDGLDGIQVQGINVPIAAYGTLGDLSGITPTFNATSVYAGTSLESPLEDHIQGVIASRTGNSIVVEGAFLLERTGIAQFADTATVTVGSNTVVSQDGVAATGLGIGSISVGQQLDIGGQATLSTAGALSMDATAGQVRMTPTQIFGTLNSATPGTASLAAETFGSFAFTDFNFSGTNVGGASANPADYILNTGSMDLSATAPGTLLQVNGFVTPFGTAPPNFNATSTVDGTATQQRLVIEWPAGVTAPFTSSSAAGQVVNLSNTALGAVHFIRTGPQELDLKSLPASPLITTTGADQANLQLAIGSVTLSTHITMYSTAAAFATAIGTTFNGTNKLYRLVAVGQFNSATNTFVASGITLAME